jgi:hypothetical protein
MGYTAADNPDKGLVCLNAPQVGAVTAAPASGIHVSELHRSLYFLPSSFESLRAWPLRVEAQAMSRCVRSFHAA